LGIDHHNRIPTTDARLLRRLVRDCKFRGRSPEQVLREWVNVREGEDVNIFPFNNEADCFFNSNCLYELSLLKKYAQDLLMQIKRDKKEYAEAQRLLRFLKYVVTLEDESYILGNSIIREFTGGSIILK
ncbi:MAG: nucleoside kinase, partial [Solobacterium sp.]|nr:nucleoside kinase [Solobacterium sp.]